MIYYLNRGIILEQAILSVVNKYFDTMRYDRLYKNFHIKATLNHPFAKLLKNESGLNAADSFPVVVVSTYNESKPPELADFRPQVKVIGIKKEDIESITGYTETIVDNGKETERVIPGLFPVVESSILEAIEKKIEEKGIMYGLSVRTYRMDKISLEIWAENAQLKNEIYEHLRLLVIGNMKYILSALKYRLFDVHIDDNTVYGQRSGAYNDQYDDVLLHGANITFDVNYGIEQIVLNTELIEIDKKIHTEAFYGKEE
jgi:hypothetical protein